nr:hypothetical protein [Acinetobacter baumannii]
MSSILPVSSRRSGRSGKALRVLWYVFKVLQRGHFTSMVSNAPTLASSLKQH